MFTFRIIASAILLLTGMAWAKTRHSASVASTTALSSYLSTRSPTALRQWETSLTPYLEQRAGIKIAPRGCHTPDDADFMILARSWNMLSPQFKALYLKAVALPAGRKVYASPGGNFDILYATSGPDSVDKRDTYGYAASADAWRLRTGVPNGIPDYVDEVAWALDSAWSMEIGRFGFIAPSAYTQTGYMSSRYKISLTNLDAEMYGLTIFTGPDQIRNRGFLSYIEIRNRWNLNPWGTIYSQHPELPTRVTAVHEFFHAVQYAMCHNVEYEVFLDDFTLGWLEGSATLMEELGFDSINDYIQYSTDYFARPHVALLDNNTSFRNNNRVYSNSLLMIHLFNHAPPTPGIDFIRSMEFNSYQAPIPFLTNLERSAASLQHTWPELLGAFHTQSYFTGDRARPGVFIPDADTMPQWNVNSSDTYNNGVLTKEVAPCAFNTFFFRRIPSQGDTLTIQFLGRNDPNTVVTGNDWAVHLLLRTNGSSTFDSILPIPLQRTEQDTFTITGWSAFSEVALVATNANTSLGGTAKTAFGTYFVERTVPVAFPNPVRRNGTIHLRGPQLEQATVFTSSGNIVSKAVLFATGPLGKGWTRTSDSDAGWALLNANGARIAPGSYIIDVRYRDTLDGTPRRKILKVLVRP